ncbi:hypothetical protein K466DRAFT_603535 [Polyporus arcularius HHB13444]|uniref:Uncharacterized protein n=1 Tax=Polyporus arcularius HHB13444 TaxID=1314778 RepID=A0A5C3P2S7_9APHY|nr:hypothetical protein K466DRAFT_603535 [Polyporus arcularius HHB13444]
MLLPAWTCRAAQTPYATDAVDRPCDHTGPASCPSLHLRARVLGPLRCCQAFKLVKKQWLDEEIAALKQQQLTVERSELKKLTREKMDLQLEIYGRVHNVSGIPKKSKISRRGEKLAVLLAAIEQYRLWACAGEREMFIGQPPKHSRSKCSTIGDVSINAYHRPASVAPVLFIRPVTVELDSWTGDNVEAPGAPLWLRSMVQSENGVVRERKFVRFYLWVYDFVIALLGTPDLVIPH